VINQSINQSTNHNQRGVDQPHVLLLRIQSSEEHADKNRAMSYHTTFIHQKPVVKRD